MIRAICDTLPRGTEPLIFRRTRGRAMLPELSFQFRDKAKKTYEQLREFAEKFVVPAEKVFEQQVNEGDRWQPTAVMEELKREAKSRGLWNLFLPESEHGAGFTNLEYAPF